MPGLLDMMPAQPTQPGINSAPLSEQEWRAEMFRIVQERQRQKMLLKLLEKYRSQAQAAQGAPVPPPVPLLPPRNQSLISSVRG